jgi:hypothetical protein
VGRPLWREVGSVICSAITHRLESRRTHNQILLSHLRLPQPGGPGSRIYIPQEQGGPVIPPGTGFPFRRLLRLAGLRRRCSNPPPHWTASFKKVKVTLRLTVSQSVCLDVEPLLVLMTRCLLLFDDYCCVFMGRPLWREVWSVDKIKIKLYCDRRSVGQFVLMSCPFWSGSPDVKFFEWQLLIYFFM